MAVKSSQLQNPERDFDINTRGPDSDAANPIVRDVATTELATLRERIKAAKAIQPTDHARHCLDCFERGRDAAIRAIEGKPDK